MKIFKRFITVLTLSTLGFAFTSSATILSWDWEVDTAFTDYTPGTVVPLVGSDNIYWATQGPISATTLSWGTEANEFDEVSSLEIAGINGNRSGTNLANGDLAETTTLTHNNFVITGDTLAGATLKTRLLLDPSPQIGDFDVKPSPLVFDIQFLETSNDATCEVISTIPCNDIFVIGGVLGDFNQQFMLDSILYNVELLVSGLGVLTNDACQAVGVENGCIGFTTIENQANHFDVNMRITAVPEPSTVLLLSLALLGIVLNTRNKHIS